MRSLAPLLFFSFFCACTSTRSNTRVLDESVHLDWVTVEALPRHQSVDLSDGILDLAVELGQDLLRTLTESAAESFAAEFDADGVFELQSDSESMKPGLFIFSRTLVDSAEKPLSSCGLLPMSGGDADRLIEDVVTSLNEHLPGIRLSLGGSEESVREVLERRIAKDGKSRTVVLYVVALVPIADAYRLFYVGHLHDALKARALTSSIPFVYGDKTSVSFALRLEAPKGVPTRDYSVGYTTTHEWRASSSGWRTGAKGCVASPLLRAPIVDSPMFVTCTAVETNRAKDWLDALAKE